MDHPHQSAVCNCLLKAMALDDFLLLRPHLHFAVTPVRLILIAANVSIEQLYFPERGFASITTERSAGRVEIGMVGREGLVGAAPLLLGVSSEPHKTFIQMAGEAYRIATPQLLAATAKSPALLALLLRYIHILMVQTAETAVANAAYTIEVRLARWLLMCRDRCADEVMPVTHQFLATMLGVRRPGVTVALQVLEGNRLIKATRGHVRVVDRPGLEAVADDSYGVPEAAYARLIGAI